MLQAVRQLSILNKLFNIRGSEWSRVFYATIIKFLYRTAFVIGWTVLVAMFVSYYGIFALPYLFVLNAFFSMIGSLLYSLFFERFQKETILIGTIFVAGLVIFSAVQLITVNLILFFALLIVGISIFLNQLRIVLTGYVEEFFTPLASERTFPIIEVSETLGGIVAGLLLTLLSDYFALSNFIYLLIGILFLIIPLVLFYKSDDDVLRLKYHEEKAEISEGIFHKLKNVFANKTYSSYIFGLIGIVLFQWILFNLLEFQYIKIVYQNVSDVIFEAGSGFEHAFVHDLGLLFILFSTSALIVEIFLGSRLISGLGVVGAMLLHPIVTLFSLLGLTFQFNFLTAVLAKNNFTITSVIHTNTYHISYYAVNERYREQVREFLEGIVRPLGAIIGTSIVILLEKFLAEQSLVFYLNVAMILFAFLFFYITYLQQEKYTKVAVQELLYSKEKSVRLNAIDILAQKGHKSAIAVFRKVLSNPDELTSVRVKIIKVLAELRNSDSILDLIECLNSEHVEIYEAALNSLLSFKLLKAYSREYLFIKYRLITALKKLYSIEKNKDILAKIIYLMSGLSNVSTVEFLFKILNSKRSSNKPQAICALGMCDDEHIAKILESYLHSENHLYQINAAIALTNFPKYRYEALHLINTFLYSDKTKKLALGLFAAGELKLKSKRNLCFKYLHSEDVNLRMYAALALAKMGFYHAVPSILKLLFSGEENVVKRVKSLLPNVDVHILKNVDKIVKQIVSRKIEELMIKNNGGTLSEFSSEVLTQLKKLYSLVDEYEEIESINGLLKNNL